MSSLTQLSQLTMVELAKRTNDQNILAISEVLSETNDIIKDATWVEGNQVASHVGTRRTSLPTGSHRQVNQGVATEASATKQITEPCCRLEAFSEVDEALIDLAPNKEEFRRNEDLAFIEGLSQTMMATLIYGNMSTDAEKIDGLATRYYVSTQANVLLGGGSGSDTTSLWIIEWGPTKTHLFYPKGSKVGLQMNDLGKQRVLDGSSNPLIKWVSQFVSQYGLFIHDDRCVQRIANIETAGSSNILDDDDVITMLNRMPQAGGGPGTRIYINRTLKTQFDILAKDKTNVNYTSDNAFGLPVTKFRGVQVGLVEQILDTETVIT